MKSVVAAAALRPAAVAALVAVASSASGQEPLRLDLSTAIVMARENNAGAEAARRRVSEARGELIGAQVLLRENPELDLAVGPWFRSAPATGQALAADVSISQRFELGGQRSHRVGRARAGVAAAEADAATALRRLDLAVAAAVLQVMAGRDRVRVAEDSARLAQELLDIAERRLGAGAGTPLEVNGARVRFAEARRALERVRAERDLALARLAPLVGAAPGVVLDVAGDLPGSATPPGGDTAQALERRPEILATRKRVEAADAEVRLASAQAIPDVRLGATYTREEGANAVLGANAFLGTITLPLPVFQRNQGERERTRAAAERARAELRAVEAEVSSEVAQAAREAERARRTLALYDESVLRAQEESLVLLRRMFEAGKVRPAEVILLQRELLEGRLGYVDARAELATADARLRTALGLPILDEADGGSR